MSKFFYILFKRYEVSQTDAQRLRPGDVAAFENRQPVTAAE